MTTLVISGQDVLIDDDDYKLVDAYSWVVDKRGYVRGHLPKQKQTVALGRLIMSAPSNREVDHINHNKLDNRKLNLRLCTRSQNVTNSVRNRSNKYRGVHKHQRCYRAKLKFNGRVYLVSGFTTPEEAAKVYNKLALKYHGEFAVLNQL